MAQLNPVTVGTEATQIAQVPAGGTITIQNIGTTNVTLGVDQEPEVGKGIILAKAASAGTPGGSLTTYPPGDPNDATWYAVSAAAAGEVAVLVVPAGV